MGDVIARFTEAFCERAATNRDEKQRLYWEARTPGFGLRVGKRAKAWFAQREVNGTTKRVTLGRYPALKVEDARRAANAAMVRMAAGINPRAERSKLKMRGLTLGDALELYAGSAARDPRTIADYRYNVTKYLGDWLDRALIELGSDSGRAEVRERHKQIAADIASGKYALKNKDGNARPHKGRTGATTANHVMHGFRTLWNRAMKQNSALPVSPTLNIDWYTVKPRRAALPFEALPKWYAGLARIAAPERRDLLLLIILTGLRSNDAKTLRWEYIHFDERRVRIPDPKGGEAFDLPLSRRLLVLLRERRKTHDELLQKKLLPPHAAPWVFGAWSASGHIVEVREAIDGVPFLVHGLRNTFANVGRKAGVVEVHVGTLMNHRQAAATITQMYGSMSLDELRKPAQLIENEFFCLFEPTPAKVARRMAVV